MRSRIFSSRTRVSSHEDAGSPRKKHSVRRAIFFAGASLFLSVATYLFSVNRNAVSGYSMRIVERRMLELSGESQRLRIREAELRSLYGLEEASGRLDMVPVVDPVSVEESESIAYGK